MVPRYLVGMRRIGLPVHSSVPYFWVVVIIAVFGPLLQVHPVFFLLHRTMYRSYLPSRVRALVTQSQRRAT